MNAVAKPREQPRMGQGHRVWTDDQRAEQARHLRTRQIWLKSSGPKTQAGKTASSRNARHADYDQRQFERTEMRYMRAYLRTQKSYTDLLKLFIKQEHSLTVARHNAMIDELFFLENELIDIERQLCGGMRFSEAMGRDERHQKQNINSFPEGLR